MRVRRAMRTIGLQLKFDESSNTRSDPYLIGQLDVALLATEARIADQCTEEAFTVIERDNG